MNAVNFYVNDNCLKGDLYTRSIGNDGNDGLTPDTPKLTLTAAYRLAKEGDIIYVDYGNYKELNASGELLFENEKRVLFVIAGTSSKVFSKLPFPTNEKIAPEIFYIKNDLPVSRETYLKHLPSNSKKTN
ncbi:hypothetical protein EZL74_05780 [Flavobacterium silvisoli]|uniref:DUF1565 domain-containing protein n=1 Tax=Flavobacterium silvisoli TaxID=2529433 RepID=A0A4V2L5A5_9FLAO|nr:hypothetical protein [Flavobacterium silvisoli]TBX69925.1 hypothetical protein EZL74_05780 [Flavobacterium silvisoli]